MQSITKILLLVVCVVGLWFIFKKPDETNMINNEGNLVISPPNPALRVGTGIAIESEDTVDDYFNASRNITTASQSPSNDMYHPLDEASGAYATYQVGTGDSVNPYSGLVRDITNEKQRNVQAPDGSFDIDMYNPNKLLPQEKRDDWFEVIEEPISIKNRHLMSLQRPIGVNTIGETLKNASHDLRAEPINPKFNTGPWMQSTFEPNYNMKSFC